MNTEESDRQEETASKTQEHAPGNSKEFGKNQNTKLYDTNSAVCSKEMNPFPENTGKLQESAQYEVLSTIVSPINSVKGQGTEYDSELQDNSDREKETDSSEVSNQEFQSGVPESLESTSYQHENKNGETELSSEVSELKNSMEGDTISKSKFKPREESPEMEVQDSVDKKELSETLPKPKPQESALYQIFSDIDEIERGELQGVGCEMQLRHSTDRECTENEPKSQGAVSDKVKSANIANKSNVEISGSTLFEDRRNRRVKYIETKTRNQILALGNCLKFGLPSLKTLISERKHRHGDLICQLDKLKPYKPMDATLCKCIYDIDLGELTGKPVFKHFQKMLQEQLYHFSILEATQVLKKLISASEWEVGRGNKGFWRKLHICCNKFGELALWLLVQSPEETANEVIPKLKKLFTEFFKKGEGKKCKIALAYVEVTFTSAYAEPHRRIPSFTELIMGSEQYVDLILGFKLRMPPRIPTIWGMDNSCMMWEAVKDLVALEDHTTVIIIGITDCGLLALNLAKEAGEVICVDKAPVIEDVKLNVKLNNLEPKCKFYAGLVTEEVRKITPKYKRVYAVVMVPTVANLMVFKERKNLSCVRSIILFLESSNITYVPLMSLANTERGMSFFPSRIIPFDTPPHEGGYMIAIRTDQVDACYKSSSRRSSESSRSEDDRTWHSRHNSAPERRERNSMLPDAREVIVARRNNKEKEQLMSASKFKADDHPNLVIEVKKPNFYNDEQRRYVKERTKEADESRYEVVEESPQCARAKQRVQDVLTDSLRRLPNLDENTAEQLKEVITEAIVGAGLVDSLHQNRESILAPPEDVDYRSEHHLSNDIGQRNDSHISYFNDGIRRNKETQLCCVNRNFQRQNIEGNCDRTSVRRTSHDYLDIGRETIQKRELLPDGRSVHIDTRETFDRQNGGDSCDRTSVNRISHYPNGERETAGKRELLSDGRSVHIDTCETLSRVTVDRSDTYGEVEAFSSRKRSLETDNSANEYSEKRRRPPQDPTLFEDIYASSHSSSDFEVAPYCNTQHTDTFPQYAVSEDNNRRSPEAHDYVTEPNRDNSDIASPVNENYYYY